jgi:hypothetical protein
MSASRTELLSLKSPSDVLLPSDSETGGDIGGEIVGDAYLSDTNGDEGKGIFFKLTV